MSADSEKRNYLYTAADMYMKLLINKDFVEDPMAMQMLQFAMDENGYMFAWDERHDLYIKKKEPLEIINGEEDVEVGGSSSGG